MSQLYIDRVMDSFGFFAKVTQLDKVVNFSPACSHVHPKLDRSVRQAAGV